MTFRQMKRRLLDHRRIYYNVAKQSAGLFKPAKRHATDPKHVQRRIVDLMLFEIADISVMRFLHLPIHLH